MKCENFSICISNTCPTNNNRCLEYKDNEHSKVTCQENGLRYEVKNNNSSIIAKYHVDGQVISGNEKKCDYMLINYCTDHCKVIFIELKGQNVPRAFEQISNTVVQLRQDLDHLPNVRYYARIVSGKCTINYLTTPKGEEFIEQFININSNKKGKCYVKLKSGTLNEKISDL